MDWIERLNLAVRYIESELDGEIDMDVAAKTALLSTYNFQRMFTCIAGMPVGEYVRRRRMTLAAFDLKEKHSKVIDVALKYGYSSPTAFNRAFKAVHSISPSEAKRANSKLTAYPAITFAITVKREKAMDYRIVKKGAFRIVGIDSGINNTDNDALKRIPEFWSATYYNGMMMKLCELCDGSEPEGLLGVCGDGRYLNYVIAAATNKPCPEGMTEFVIDEHDWAVFECKGSIPDSIQNMQKRIMSEWLPTSGYSFAPDAPDIEVYPDGDNTSEDYATYIWLPVVKA